MKKFLSLVVLVASHAAFADTFTPIQNGDMSLSGARAEIVSIQPRCPKVPGQMSCMAYGSQVRIKVTLRGCVDRLGGFFSSFDEIDRKPVLSFGAVNVTNRASMAARCVQAPVQFVDVYVPYEGRDIVLKPLHFVGSARN